jgi:hypothetical protein
MNSRLSLILIAALALILLTTPVQAQVPAAPSSTNQTDSSRKLFFLRFAADQPKNLQHLVAGYEDLTVRHDWD